MKRFWFVTFVVMVLVLGLGMAGCSGTAVQGQSTQAAPTLAPVKSSSSLMAEGKVVPLENAELSFSTSGVISEVLVKAGDTVKGGQPLLRLKGNEQLSAAVSNAELEVLTSQQGLDDLDRNHALQKAQAEMAVADARKELDKAQKKSNSKEYQHGDQDQIEAARANYILAKKAFDDAQEAYGWVKDAGVEDPTVAGALSAMASARQQRDVAQANLNYLLAKPNELDVSQMEAQLKLAQARMADAEKKLAEIQNGPDAAQRALAEARLKNAQVQLQAARARLSDLELSSPLAGTVISVDGLAGEFIQPGKVVVQIANVSNWMVETTDLTELNIARVKEGMPAMVRFDALPGVDLIGRVERINLLGENRQGDIVYAVRLKLDKPDERLRWNMTSSVTFLEK